VRNIKLFLILVIFAISSYAQVSKPDTSESSSYIFDAYLINGYELGYSVFSKENSEFRLLLGLSSSHGESETDVKQVSINNDVSSTNETTHKSKDGHHQINFRTQYLYKFYKSNLGESYLGIGSWLGYRLYDYSSENVSTDSYYKSSHSESSILVGITALIGIRSYLTNSLSVFAETQIHGTKIFIDEDHESEENGDFEYNRKIDGDGWGISIYYIRLGLRFSI
jgi:hypothetical protein